MKAKLIFEPHQRVETRNGKHIIIHMDLYKLPQPYHSSYPEGFKFSWIAMEEGHEEKRVLFDCHSPKGPHFHIDNDKEGASFDFETVEQARILFFKKVIEKFGDIQELLDLIKGGK